MDTYIATSANIPLATVNASSYEQAQAEIAKSLPNYLLRSWKQNGRVIEVHNGLSVEYRLKGSTDQVSRTAADIFFKYPCSSYGTFESERRYEGNELVLVIQRRK